MSLCHQLIGNSFDFWCSSHCFKQIFYWSVKYNLNHHDHQSINNCNAPSNCVIITWCHNSRRVAVDPWVTALFMIKIMTSFYGVILDILCLNQFQIVTVKGSNRVHICLLKCLHWVGSLSLPVVHSCFSSPNPSQTDLHSRLTNFFSRRSKFGPRFLLINHFLNCDRTILKVWVDLNQLLGWTVRKDFIVSFGWK